MNYYKGVRKNTGMIRIIQFIVLAIMFNNAGYGIIMTIPAFILMVMVINVFKMAFCMIFFNVASRANKAMRSE